MIMCAKAKVRRPRRQTLRISVLQIAGFLRKYPNSYLLFMCEHTGLARSTVHKCLGLLQPMLVVTNNENAEGLPRMRICYKLKTGVSNERIVRWLKLKKDVKGL